jgi:threonine synthase
VPTVANAMDVGDPSNFERLLALHGGALEAMRQNLWSRSVSDAEAGRCLRAVYERTGYLLDPHGAIGYAAACAYAEAVGGDEPIVTLATAHPAKFPAAIRAFTGVEPALPEPFRGWERWPLLAEALPDVRYETFRRVLVERAGAAA